MRLVSGCAFLMKLLCINVIPLKVISIGSYTPLHMSLPGLEASPEVIF
jgi:hypothetical protein